MNIIYNRRRSDRLHLRENGEIARIITMFYPKVFNSKQQNLQNRTIILEIIGVSYTFRA